MPNEAQADHLKRWDMALAAGVANAEEPGVDDLRVQLQTAADGARSKIARRNLLKYQLQQTSRELREIMSTGKAVFSRLVHVVKGRYGPESEKVVEWGIQPRRPAQVTMEQKVERFLEKQKEKPSEPGVAPAQTADSQTVSRS